jgi:hypothetical protein
VELEPESPLPDELLLPELPPLSPPELPPPDGFLASLELSEVDRFESARSDFFSDFEELYRSAYQPPPLRMKPAPPDTWRLAASALQLGHDFSGASLID